MPAKTYQARVGAHANQIEIEEISPQGAGL
jgi:hypothetical protein